MTPPDAWLPIESDRVRRWGEIPTEFAIHLLAGMAPQEALRRLAGAVRDVSDADVAVVLSPCADDPSKLAITVAEGRDVEDIEGVRIPLPGTKLGETYATGAFRVFEDVTVLPIVGQRAAVVVELTLGYGPAMFVPMGEMPGRRLLAVLRVAGSPPFDKGDPELMVSCAACCARLLDLSADQERRHRRELQDDRERIARDLHDHVVQRMFAIGLSLDRVGRALELEHPEAAARVSRNVDDLDDTMTEIRTAIFELQQGEALQFPTAGEPLADVVRHVTEGQPVNCTVRVQGPVDEIPGGLLPEVNAVVRELVTNVVRHARATRATVLVLAGTSTLEVVVTDNGVGMPPVGIRSGLANLTERAERLRGRLTTASAPSGTEVRWTVPLPDA